MCVCLCTYSISGYWCCLLNGGYMQVLSVNGGWVKSVKMWTDYVWCVSAQFKAWKEWIYTLLFNIHLKLCDSSLQHWHWFVLFLVEIFSAVKQEILFSSSLQWLPDSPWFHRFHVWWGGEYHKESYQLQTCIQMLIALWISSRRDKFCCGCSNKSFPLNWVPRSTGLFCLSLQDLLGHSINSCTYNIHNSC